MKKKRMKMLLLMAVLALGYTMPVYAGDIEPMVSAEQESILGSADKDLLPFEGVVQEPDGNEAGTGVENGTGTVNSEDYIELTGISLNKSSVRLDVGDSEQLEVLFYPENATDNKEINWYTTDTEIVSVEDGMIYAKSPGDATVTAKTINGLTAACEVMVNPISLESLDLDVSVSAESFAAMGPHYYTEVTVKDGEKTLIKGTDYSLNFTDDVEKVILKGMGKYTGTVERAYEFVVGIPDWEIRENSDKEVGLYFSRGGIGMGHVVYRADGADKEYKKIGEVDGYVSYYYDYNLLAGITCYYKVQAYIEFGGNKTYGPCSEAKAVQHKLKAPGNLQVRRDTYTSLKISWDPVEEADYYQVYYSRDAYGKYTLLGEYDSSTLSVVSRNLLSETMYYYKVRAYLLVDGEKVFSSFCKGKGNYTVLPAPKGVTAESASYSTVKVSWEKEDIESYYEVYRAASESGKYYLLGVYDKDTTSIISKSLGTGITYYYKVRRYCMVDGRKVYSSYSEVTSAAPLLSAPKGVTAKGATYSTVKVSWEKTAGVSYYEVYRATSRTGRYVLLGVYDKDTTSMTSRSLGAGITYYYKVRGYRWSGGERRYGPFSEAVSAVPVLSAPKGVTAKGTGPSTVRVSWSKTDGANYYQVYRAASKTGKYSLLGVYDKNTTSMTSKALKRGTTYYYKVRCYRWVNGQRVFSKWSTVVPATTTR